MTKHLLHLFASSLRLRVGVWLSLLIVCLVGIACTSGPITGSGPAGIVSGDGEPAAGSAAIRVAIAWPGAFST